MQFLEDLFVEPLRYLKAFLVGRGLLTAAVFTAWAATGGTGAAIVVGIGGALFTGYMRFTNQRIYEDTMTNMYRDGIAQQLGIEPGQVTRAHLKEAAKTNDVIDQALERQRSISTVSFVTAGLAAAATIGLLMTPLPAAMATFFGGMESLGVFAKVLSYASTGIIAGLSSLLLHDTLESVIGRKKGLNKAAAHDRIMEMERGISRGWGISKEQVYGALVAGNPALQQTIAREFGKPYADMRPSEQAHVLNEIGVADEMLAIASEINAGRLRPANLAFMMNEALPRTNTPRAAEEPSPSPARSHVAALGRTSRDATMGHVARLDADRAMAALSERSV